MTLHPLAKDTLIEIGNTVPPQFLMDWFIQFYGDIKRLDDIARRTHRRKDAQDIIDALDMPLMVGDVKLYRLSVGGIEWVQNFPQKWWGLEGDSVDLRLVELATCFAMAHREKEEYSNLVSKAKAGVKILEWAKGLKVSEEVLVYGASCLLPENDPVARLIMGVGSEEDSEHFSIASLASKVAPLAGVSTFSAIWEIPAETFWGFYCDYIDEKEAEANAELKASKKAPHVEAWVSKQKIALIKGRRELIKNTLKWLKENEQRIVEIEESNNG
jgi:hypothetical protein